MPVNLETPISFSIVGDTYEFEMPRSGMWDDPITITGAFGEEYAGGFTLRRRNVVDRRTIDNRIAMLYPNPLSIPMRHLNVEVALTTIHQVQVQEKKLVGIPEWFDETRISSPLDDQAVLHVLRKYEAEMEAGKKKLYRVLVRVLVEWVESGEWTYRQRYGVPPTFGHGDANDLEILADNEAAEWARGAALRVCGRCESQTFFMHCPECVDDEGDPLELYEGDLSNRVAAARAQGKLEEVEDVFKELEAMRDAIRAKSKAEREARAA